MIASATPNQSELEKKKMERSTYHRALKLEPRNHMQYSVIPCIVSVCVGRSSF